MIIVMLMVKDDSHCQIYADGKGTFLTSSAPISSLQLAYVQWSYCTLSQSSYINILYS